MGQIANNLLALNSAKHAIREAINAKGGGPLTAGAPLSDYAAAIAAIPTGSDEPPVEKDVNFYDYDGTLVASYSKADFLNLSELPENPDRTADGLTARGWNWPLADAKTYVQKYGFLVIGQLYTPTDGKVHIDLNMTIGGNDHSFYFKCPQDVAIDWGDGNTGTITASPSSWRTMYHTYAAGKYTIKIDAVAGLVFGGGPGRYIEGIHLADNVGFSSYSNSSYPNLKYFTFGKVPFSISITMNNLCSLRSLVYPPGGYTYGRLGYSSAFAGLVPVISLAKDTTLDSTFYYGLYMLKNMCVPQGVTSIPAKFVSSAFDLKKIVIPDSVTDIGNEAMGGCYSLKDIKIPDTVTTIGQYAFNACFSLEEIVIPAAVTSIGDSVLNNCHSLKSITVLATTPPTLGSSAFPSYAAIYVPAASVATYKAATNWRSYSSRIFAIPE